MLKAILWDNDGVLVDTEHLYFQATAQILAERQVGLSEEDFIRISLTQGQSALALAVKSENGEMELEILRRRRDALYASLLEGRLTAMEGVHDTLLQLKNRFRMVVVTGCRRNHFQIIHRQTGLLPFFEFALVREDYHHPKPHPEAYLKALERMELKAEECLVVEDSPRGLLAASRAGLRCCVIPNRLTAGGDFGNAHRVLNHIRELPSLLAGLSSS
ncbi:HAD family phosphatase [Desulfuromonas sp. AOP6]|uniref:HAD family hydrolase n=1 Tax=Desulfuromonas sp. AOP6 TaxID=1566351 RepID=UPI001282F38E|nr:HAD family phosphatase [Desulfuromonas sp. AOP6]BCA79421.1 haloacid dehalogenase [Desulfuromonas sp. AOP6]